MKMIKMLLTLSFCLVLPSISFADTSITVKCYTEDDITWALKKTTVLQINFEASGYISSGKIDGVTVKVSKDSLYLEDYDWWYSFERVDLIKVGLGEYIEMTILNDDYLALFNVDVNCLRIR